MEYTAWVEAIMNSMAEACDNSSGIVKIRGFSLLDVMRLAGFADAAESLYRRNTDPGRAVEGALFDLGTMGLLKVLDGSDSYVVTNRGHQFSRTMERLWHEIMGKWLSETQWAFLTQASQMWRDMGNYGAWLETRDVFRQLGWAERTDAGFEADALVGHLEDEGLALGEPLLVGWGRFRPTYQGIVRVTKGPQAEEVALIDDLITEWETTNVDFKRQLNLGTKKGKAEFIKDILAVATTKSSGRRFLVVGFDDDTRAFFQSLDDGVQQERLEQILNAYTEPTPTIKLSRVRLDGGVVGLIEVFRSPDRVPYIVKKNLGGSRGIQQGDVFVRHGSHAERPSPQELKDLWHEGRSTEQPEGWENAAS